MTTINCKFAIFKYRKSHYLCALYSETKDSKEVKKSTLFPIKEHTYDEITRSGLLEDVAEIARNFMVSTLDAVCIEQNMLCVKCEEVQCDEQGSKKSGIAVEVEYKKVTYSMKCETDLQNIAELLKKSAGFGRFNLDRSIYAYLGPIDDDDDDSESKLRICESPKKITKHVAPPNIKIAHRRAKQAAAKQVTATMPPSRGAKRKLETSDDDNANDEQIDAFSKAV